MLIQITAVKPRKSREFAVFVADAGVPKGKLVGSGEPFVRVVADSAADAENAIADRLHDEVISAYFGSPVDVRRRNGPRRYDEMLRTCIRTAVGTMFPYDSPNEAAAVRSVWDGLNDAPMRGIAEVAREDSARPGCGVYETHASNRCEDYYSCQTTQG